MLALVAAVALASDLDADVRALSGVDPIDVGDGPVTLVSRNVHHPHTHLAAAWLEARLRAIDGLSVRTEPVDVDGADVVNLIADRPGLQPDAPWLVVAAHYDSTASADAGYDPATSAAPGADDDASGVAVVLEVARRLQGASLGRSIRFALFTGEEEGLVGSAAHVAQLELPGVHLMYSLDPVGYDPGDAGVLWVAYDAAAEDAAFRFEALDSALDVYAVDEALIGGDDRSDQYNFRAAGYPAVHLGSYPQPPTYHTAGDTHDVVNPAFVAGVADLVEAHVRELAVEYLPVEQSPAVLNQRGACDATGGLALPGLVGAGVAAALSRRASASSARGRRRTPPPPTRRPA